jgi:hypothetical protein
MNEILTPEQWSDLQGRIRKLHPELTDADLQYHEAAEQDMLAMVVCSLQKSKETMQGKPVRHNRIPDSKEYWRYNRKSHMKQQM